MSSQFVPCIFRTQSLYTAYTVIRHSADHRRICRGRCSRRCCCCKSTAATAIWWFQAGTVARPPNLAVLSFSEKLANLMPPDVRF